MKYTKVTITKIPAWHDGSPPTDDELEQASKAVTREIHWLFASTGPTVLVPPPNFLEHFCESPPRAKINFPKTWPLADNGL